MSSSIVRATFRQALQDFFPAVQYVPALAERTDNEQLEPLWQTVEFVPESDGPIGIGAPTCCREVGIARIWISAASGFGDQVATAQADAVINAFRRFYDPVAQIRVVSNNPPQSAQQSDGKWLQLAVDLRYNRDYIA